MYEGPIQGLTDKLSHLPGIGPRGVQRIAFRLFDAPGEGVFQLVDVLCRIKEAARSCEVCLNVSQETHYRVCRSPRRSRSLLYVVEESKDMAAIERIGELRDTYHVLGGSISPIDGRGPDDLHTRELFQRLVGGIVTEMILTTDPDTEDEAAASYLGRVLRDFRVRVTWSTFGLPIDGDIKHADQIILGRAFKGHHSMFGDEPEPVLQPTPEEPAWDETTGDGREHSTVYQSLVETPAR